MRTRWLSLVALLLLFSIVLLPLARAHALDARGGERVVIPAGEVINDDLYVAASELLIEGEVNGDVYFLGQTLTITGQVKGDVNALGQVLILKGMVQDDVRFFGVIMHLAETAQVGSDLLAFGASLDLRPGSQVGQDVLFYGSQSYIGAEIGRNLRVGAESVMLTGHVKGDADLSVTGREGASSPAVFGPATVPVPSLPGGFTLDPSARIDGNLNYQSEHPLADLERNVGGKVTYEPFAPEPKAEKTIWERLFDSLRSLVTLLFFGTLFAWVSPRLLQESTQKIREHFWPSIGWGVLTYAMFFFALLVVVVIMILGGIFFSVLTLSGISAVIVWGSLILIAVLLFAFIFTTAYLTKVIVGWEIGQWLLGKAVPQWAEKRYAPLLGIAILGLLLEVPYLGFVIGLLVLFIGLGALWLLGRSLLTKPSNPATPVQEIV